MADSVNYEALAHYLLSKGSHGVNLGPNFDKHFDDPAQLAAYLKANPSEAAHFTSGDFQQYSKQYQQDQFQTNAQTAAEDIYNKQKQFADQLMKPLDKNDPMYRSVLSAAANAGGGAAEAAGVNGPLAARSVEGATANAFAQNEMQRQGLAANVLAGGGATALGAGNLGLAGGEFDYQKHLNSLAQQQALGGTVGGALGSLAGGALGFAVGGPPGMMTGAGLGGKLGTGLGSGLSGAASGGSFS